MGRPSKIDRMPAEIRELIADLRREGRTIAEILTALRSLGAEVSKSGLGRHVQGLDRVLEDLQRHRALAEAIATKLPELDDGSALRANVELLHALISKLRTADPDQLDPRDAMFLASALQKIASASSADVVRLQRAEQRAAERARREAAAQAEAAVDTVAARRGLSADTVADLKAAFLGIRE